VASSLEAAAAQETPVLDVNRPDAAIQAAGGAVLRPGPDGEHHVLLVHRPAYDDWTLPKGKLLEGESHESAAVREVEEETGVWAELGEALPMVSYRDRFDRPKEVRYWAMRVVKERPFAPNAEVDEIRWLSLDEASRLLSYDHDREVLSTVHGGPGAGPGTVYLVRHAKAGDRAAWSEDDRLRPLSKKGRRQGEALLKVFRPIEVTRIVSSPYDRCVQTVRPLAVQRGVIVEIAEELAEGADVQAARALVDALPGGSIVCSHGDVIPALLGWFAARGAPVAEATLCQKGSVWALSRAFGRVVEARYTPPPVE
jgi:8-oxo-(d)GTP phosphatase